MNQPTKEIELTRENNFYEVEAIKGFVENYNSLSIVDSKGRWIENCEDCRRPMSLMLISPSNNPEINPEAKEVTLRGIVESVRGVALDPRYHSRAYKDWVVNPVINPAAEFWYCGGCQSIWTIVGSFWTRVLVDGKDKFEEERIKILSPAEVTISQQEPFDPGEKPSDDSTPCPHCHIWRSVEPYSEVYVQHVCPKCHTVDLVRIPQEPQATQV